MNTIENTVETIIGQSTNPKSIVLCLGSNISLLSGAPTFQNISEVLCDYYRISKNDLSVKNSEAFYEYLTNVAGRHDVVATIAKLYKGLSPSDLHRALAKSPINIFITTNFDTLLENAFKEEKNAFAVLTVDSPFFELEKRKIVLKLSGTLEKPDTLVLTRLDQKLTKKSHSELQNLIRYYLANNLVLFIGFDLKDGLSDFYERFGLESKILSNWIVLAEKPSLLDDNLWNRRGVKLLDIKTELLPSVVNELSLRISKYESRTQISRKKRKVFIGGDTRNIHLLHNIEKILRVSELYPILLREEPDAGRTLSEKFSALVKDADAAIVILEGEEKGMPGMSGSNANFFFELGFLVSSLGQENVMVVQSTKQNLPTAFVGSEILYYDAQKPNLFTKRLKNWLTQL